MIYSSQHYSTAMLEKLVNGSGHLPPNQHYIEMIGLTAKLAASREAS
jgi:RES domain-containing protein